MTFEGWSWLNLNNLGLALETNLKFYTSVVKRLKLKVRKFLGVIPTFVKIKGEKLVRGGGGDFLPLLPSWIGLILKLRIFKKRDQQNILLYSLLLSDSLQSFTLLIEAIKFFFVLTYWHHFIHRVLLNYFHWQVFSRLLECICVYACKDVI